MSELTLKEIHQLNKEVDTNIALAVSDLPMDQALRFSKECYPEVKDILTFNTAVSKEEEDQLKSKEDDSWFTKFFKFIARLIRGIYRKIASAIKTIGKWLGLVSSSADNLAKKTESAETIEENNIKMVADELQDKVDEDPNQKIEEQIRAVVNEYAKTANEPVVNSGAAVAEALSRFADIASKGFQVQVKVDIPEEILRKFIPDAATFDKINKNNDQRTTDKTTNAKAKKEDDGKVKINKLNMAKFTHRTIRHQKDAVHFVFNKNYPPFTTGYLDEVKQLMVDLGESLHIVEKEFDLKALGNLIANAASTSGLINSSDKVVELRIPHFCGEVIKNVEKKIASAKIPVLNKRNISANKSLEFTGRSTYQIRNPKEFNDNFDKYIKEIGLPKVESYTGDNGLQGSYQGQAIATKEMKNYVNSLQASLKMVEGVHSKIKDADRIDFDENALMDQVFGELFKKNSKTNFRNNKILISCFKILAVTLGSYRGRYCGVIASICAAILSNYKKQIDILANENLMSVVLSKTGNKVKP